MNNADPQRTQQDIDLFTERNGVFVPRSPVHHRDEEYDPRWFEILIRMQRDHFWYCGRSRFLLRALYDELPRIRTTAGTLTAIDIGGACGGWIEFLHNSDKIAFGQLALGDSSLEALTSAGPIVGSFATRYQVDVLDLGWEDRWDVIFLLDVLEHIPADEAAVSQVAKALRPNGLLFVTAPAMRFFWSYNDEITHHLRRYSRRDMERLAQEAGMRLVKLRYFMFFLSPLLWLRKLTRVNVQRMTPEEKRAVLARTHSIPSAPLNRLLRSVFSLETPLGLKLPFPWGTSILGVFQKI